MTTIIRGGQTTLHYIRMLRQISLSLIKIAFGTILISTAYILSKSPVITLFNLKIYLVYSFSKVLVNFKAYNALLRVADPDGNLGTYRAIDIVSTTSVSDVFYSVNYQVLNALTTSLKYGIIASLVFFGIFFIRGVLATRKKIIQGQELLTPSKLAYKIRFYNFFDYLLNMENHLRVFKQLSIIAYQLLLLLLKSPYNLLLKAVKLILKTIKLTINFIAKKTFPDSWIKLCTTVPKITRIYIIGSLSQILLLNTKTAKSLISGLKLILTFKRLPSKKHLRRILRAIRKIRVFFVNVKLAKIPYPKQGQYSHTLITGGSGTGKTVLINSIITQVRKNNQKAIIYDKMGSFTKNFYDPKTDILLNPLDARSANWDLIKECPEKPFCDDIAEAFIPSKASDPFWEDSARLIFSEVLHKAKNLTELSDLLFYDQNARQKIIDNCSALRNAMPEKADKTLASILMVMYSKIDCLKNLQRSNNGFSIRDWIKDDSKKGFLIISSRADQQKTLRPLLTAMFEVAINSILSLKQKPSRNLWVFLDELPTLQYIPSFQSALAESRQFGTSFVLALQLMSQLKDIYGREKAESVSGLCRNRVVFGTPDDDTAKWCSNTLGKMEVEESQESFTYGSHDMRDGVSLNRKKQIVNLVTSGQIMDLEKLNCYIRFGAGFGTAKTKLKPKKYKDDQEGFIQKEVLDERIESTAQDAIQDESTNEDVVLADDNQSLDNENQNPQSIDDPILDLVTTESLKSKDKVILDLIKSESLEGKLYTISAFSEKFEDKKGLGSKNGIVNRISILASRGIIKFNRNFAQYDLKDSKCKYGLLIAPNMQFTDSQGEVFDLKPTHIKCSHTGAVLEAKTNNNQALESTDDNKDDDNTQDETSKALESFSDNDFEEDNTDSSLPHNKAEEPDILENNDNAEAKIQQSSEEEADPESDEEDSEDDDFDEDYPTKEAGFS